MSCMFPIQQSLCSQVHTEHYFSSDHFSIIDCLSVEWAIIFQAQQLLAAFILQISFRQSLEHHHHLLSAIFNCSSDQAGPQLVSVLRDQNYLAAAPAEQIASLTAFRLPPHTGGFQFAPS
jgi:hypothetical protein